MTLSNSSISSWSWNRPSSYRFEHVYELRFNVTTPITLDSCRFIQQMFSRVRTLVLSHCITAREGDDDDDDNDEEQYVYAIADCLLGDNTLKLPTVHALKLASSTISIDAVAFRRLLKLLPNLKCLQSSRIGWIPFTELDFTHEDPSVQETMSRIRKVEIGSLRSDQLEQVRQNLSQRFLFAQLSVDTMLSDDDDEYGGEDDG